MKLSEINIAVYILPLRKILLFSQQPFQNHLQLTFISINPILTFLE